MNGPDLGRSPATQGHDFSLARLVALAAGAMLSGALAVAQTGTAAEPVRSKATLAMVDRLRQLADTADPKLNRFLNDQRVEMFDKAALAATTPTGKLQARISKAIEMLQAGRSEAAAEEFRWLEQNARTLDPGTTPADLMLVRTGRAISLLRIGEQENCLANHNADSCLFPIRGGGVHLLPRGSKSAIPVIESLLAADPGDLQARWILNIAHMTLGTWPEQVPPAFVIPPSVFESDHPMPRFPDVAGAVGLSLESLGGGVVIEDLDNDGLLDVMVSSWALRGQLRYLHNDGDGRFTDRTREAGLMGLWGGLNMVSADYDNDGFTDVFVLRGAWLGVAGHHPNSLLRNRGDGTFEDVTEAAGLLSFNPTQAARWFDYNGDGKLDLFIGNESQRGDRLRCELYRNNGDGTFTECGVESGFGIIGFVKGVAVADYDGDNRPDLYLSRLDGANLLFHNEGPANPGDPASKAWRFTTVAKTAGVEQPDKSFPTWFFDYDQDGRPDLYVGGYNIENVGDIVADQLGKPSRGERSKLYRNRGDGTFEDVSRAAQLDHVLHAMGSNFGDLDNDGYPDFYLGTGNPDLLTLVPNRMFRNAEGRFFQDVTTATGTGNLQKGHAVAFADLDNDGDQDVFENMGGAFTGDPYHHTLYQNPGSTNHWLTLKLEGVRSNRSAIGARIKVSVATPRGPRDIYRWVDTGGSFGCNPLRAEIGLGDAAAIRSVEVLWPATGKTQVLTGIDRDRFYTFREGDAAAKPWDVKRVRFATGSVQPHAEAPKK